MKLTTTASSNRKYAQPEMACGKDASRPMLHDPWLEISPDGEGTLYATDSYVAVRIPVGLDSGDTPGVVPVGVLKAARQGPMKHVLLNGDATAIGKDGTVSAPRPDDHDPPNLAQLFPEYPETSVSFAINADNLVKIAKALGADLGVRITFNPHKPLGPIHVQPLAGARGEGLVMPIRLPARG